MEYPAYFVASIAGFVMALVAYTLLYYRHYSRGGKRWPERSTFLDGMILFAIICIIGDGSPYGQLAAELTIVAVAILVALRGADTLAWWAANRGDKESPAGRG